MMDNSYMLYIFSNILIGILLSLILGWVAIKFARRFGPMDIPGILPHKQHAAPTPLAGGYVIVLTLLVGGILFNFPMVREQWRILVPALIIFAMGLWDDFIHLPAWIKLISQILAGILLIALGTYVQIVPQGFLGLPGKSNLIFNWLITLFWMVGMTNAFNLIDSMDGLALGTGGLGIAFMVIVTLDTPQVSLLRLLTLALGTCVGLYYYNHTPARLFLGDSGAQMLGFLLAAVGIQFTPGTHPLGSSWFIPILIFGVPIFDTTLVTISRLRRRTHVYEAGLDHTYHRLVKMGFDNRRAVLVMHFATILLGCVAFLALQLSPLVATLVFVAICLLGLSLVFWMDKKI